MQQEIILAEFKGTYRAPHPEGFKDQNITKPFHVIVKMPRDFLIHLGLNGLFATYYKDKLRQKYRDLIDTYEFDLVQATELDGSVIDDPKALCHEGLLQYIKLRKYTINPLLYSTLELRDEIILYETDKKGQQFLQAKRESYKGNALKLAAELSTIEDIMTVIEPGDEPEPVLAKASKKGRKGSFVEAIT